MPAVLYPCGYDGSDMDRRVDEFVELDELLERKLRGAHPEFVRRVRACLDAAGGLVGIGTGHRSSSLQRAVFLQRHERAAFGGCCSLGGVGYRLKPGMAHAAPPGLSWHEEHAWVGGLVGSQALDAVGHDETGPQSHAVAWRWLRDHAHEFGLMTAWNWTQPEAWHTQLAELPRSVSQWVNAGRPNPKHFALPAPPQPEDDTVRMPKFRIKGYTRQWVGFPLSAETNQAIDATDQAPIVLETTASQAELERELGPLTRTQDGR